MRGNSFKIFFFITLHRQYIQRGIGRSTLLEDLQCQLRSSMVLTLFGSHMSSSGQQKAVR